MGEFRLEDYEPMQIEAKDQKRREFGERYRVALGVPVNDFLCCQRGLWCGYISSIGLMIIITVRLILLSKEYESAELESRNKKEADLVNGIDKVGLALTSKAHLKPCFFAIYMNINLNGGYSNHQVKPVNEETGVVRSSRYCSECGLFRIEREMACF